MKCSGFDFLGLSEEILGKKADFCFKANGRSMFPAIRDGDVLTVCPAPADEIKPLDIIFYRTQDARPAAHRVIKKIVSPGETVFETRGDYYGGGCEAIPFTGVMGKVNRITRKGRTFDIDRGMGRLNDLFCFYISPFINKAKNSLAFLLHCLQNARLYRWLARRLINVHAVYEKMLLRGHDVHITARVRDSVIGEITVGTFDGDDDDYKGFWIFGTWVSWRFRRLGIGRQLTAMACDAAAGRGAQEVMLFVFKDNRAAIRLYEGSGFRQTSIPAIDGQLRKEAGGTGRLRIIMKKDVRQ